MISVIVPVYNCEKTLVACIDSLLNQNYDDYELIIVDNNSTDKTSQMLKKYSKTHSKKISVYKEKRKGAYAARNLGLSYAKGEIVALTDADCVADPDWVVKLTTPLKNKHIKLSGGVTKSQSLSSSLLRYCNKFCNMQKKLSSCSIPFFGGGNMSFRKKDAKKIGNFPLVESGGDVIFCSRLIESTSEVKFVKDAIVYHAYENSFLSFLKKQYYYGKWHSHRERRFKLSYEIRMPSYSTVLKKYGAVFLFFRISQDLAYMLGNKF